MRRSDEKETSDSVVKYRSGSSTRWESAHKLLAHRFQNMLIFGIIAQVMPLMRLHSLDAQLHRRHQ
jgi:hypothetical protein